MTYSSADPINQWGERRLSSPVHMRLSWCSQWHYKVLRQVTFSKKMKEGQWPLNTTKRLAITREQGCLAWTWIYCGEEEHFALLPPLASGATMMWLSSSHDHRKSGSSFASWVSKVQSHWDKHARNGFCKAFYRTMQFTSFSLNYVVQMDHVQDRLQILILVAFLMHVIHCVWIDDLIT